MRAHVVLFALAVSCGSAKQDDPPAAPPKTVTLERCDDRSVPVLGGGCTRIGAPCAAGFAEHADGCLPVLPAAKCAAGRLAVLGDLSCRPILACGDDRFGAPPDDTSLFVDASFSGTSDGSRARPFPTIGAALTVAATDARIAIADGLYVENLELNKPIRLWGRCPERVTIDGRANNAVGITARAEIRGVTLTGNIGARYVAGVGSVLEKVHIRNAAFRGVDITYLAPVSVTIRDSVIEDFGEVGIFVSGGRARIERVWIHGARGTADGLSGTGVVSRNRTTRRGEVELVDSLLEDLRTYGTSSLGSQLTIERVAFRNFLGNGVGRYGRAVATVDSDGLVPGVVVRDSFVEGARGAAIALRGGALATFERVTVRDMRPEVADPNGPGHVLNVIGGEATLRDCSFARAINVGIAFEGVKATIERSILRDVRPTREKNAAGLGILGLVGSVVTVRDSIVDRVDSGAALAFNGSTLELIGSAIRRSTTVGNDGFGDGVSLITSAAHPASAHISRSRIDDATRAGVSLFGANLVLEDSVVACSGIDLNVETLINPPVLEDRGGNTCGCDKLAACRGQSTGLAPVQTFP